MSYDFHKLDELMSNMPAYGLPATDLAVTYKGETVYRRGVGFSDVEKTKPVSPDDIYWIFSVSKVTTCIAANRLVEEGRIGLDDPVSKYLPAFASPMVRQKDGSLAPAKNVMTIRHLFTMTAGFDYNFNSPAFIALRKENPHFSTIEGVNAIAKSPLWDEPGTVYRYSLCHDVLAGVVEAVSGERFADYVKRVIFDPLGMKNTGYHPTEEVMSRMTQMYRYVPGLMLADPIDHTNAYILSDNYDSGGAGLHSTVDDQIALMTTLANGGTTKDGYRLLKPETIAMIGTNQLADSARITLDTTRLYGYSWGLCCRTHINRLFSRSPSALGEFGWDGAAAAYALVDPTNRIAIFFGTEVLNCNFAYHQLHPLLRDAAYEALGI